MENFGIYKKVSDPVLGDSISLIRQFDTKGLAETALTNFKDNKNTHYYVAELKR